MLKDKLYWLVGGMIIGFMPYSELSSKLERGYNAVGGEVIVYIVAVMWLAVTLFRYVDLKELIMRGYTRLLGSGNCVDIACDNKEGE